MPTLRTERLVLRPIARCDEAALHRFWITPEVRRYLWDNRILSRENVQEIIRNSQAYFDNSGSGFFAIETVAQPGRLAGFCGHRAFEGGDHVELLYGILPEFWGEGLMTEATTEVLRFGFEDCSFERIIAATDTPNQRSVNVMQRLGMVFMVRREWHGLDTVFYELDKPGFLRRP
ncbi:MAG: GNAT family N-acetyltransferase [Pseudomonadales bacterium]|nr:GNAT family N-acetyltransferase [Pseudomonadales bacterium]